MVTINTCDKIKGLSDLDSQKVLDFQKEFPVFMEYFERNKIYLSEELANAIFVYLIFAASNIVDSLPQKEFDKFKHSSSLSNEYIEKTFSSFKQLYDNMKQEGYGLPEMLRDLQNEFRTLIGAEIKREK